ncbi:MAG: hypothetical protein KatS3mg019_0054 [Fimbriimonadales bacterium]|nr:MAG: hypothetical protein KatS3mg019_0054 [Fimbriimonadales bacterium]
MTMNAALSDILRRLFSESELDRELAVRALLLAEAHSDEVLEALTTVLKDDPSYKVRVWSALALGCNPWQEEQLDKVSLALAEAVYRDSNAHVRTQAAAALRLLFINKTPNELVVRCCVHALEDEEPRVIVAAVYALEKAPHNEVDERLLSLLDHENLFVRLSAIDVLIRRGHRSERIDCAIDRLLPMDYLKGEMTFLFDESEGIYEVSIYDYVLSLRNICNRELQSED